MRVVVVCEHRFLRTPSGEVLTGGAFDYTFWKRYLAVFDSVSVVARLRPATTGDARGARADGPGISFAGIPYYSGPYQFLRRAVAVRRSLRKSVSVGDAVILRAPSVLGSQLEPWLRKRRHPFAVEVVGDPWDALGPGAYQHPLRELFRRRLASDLRRQCAAGCATLYVTAKALQRRYPPRADALTVACSDVHLPPSAFVPAPRTVSVAPRPATLLMAGSLDHLYKAPDLVINAVARCRRDYGMDLRLVIAGGGGHQAALASQARALGIANRVSFLGQLPCGEAVREQLDAADLFLQASRQEGLPRALLEAMARAAPAIGSTAGGIPELLDAEDLTPVNDLARLVAKIREVLSSPGRLSAMSARNLSVARAYEEARLQVRWVQFLGAVKATCEIQRAPVAAGRWLVGASPGNS